MKRRPRVAVGVLLIAGLLTACGTAVSSRGSGGGDRNLVTRQELQEFPELTVFEFVRQWRPIWLRARRGDINIGAQTGLDVELRSERGIRVYMDGTYQGDGTSFLNRIFVPEIQQLQWLSATDASQRFGTGHSSGAILITSRR